MSAPKMHPFVTILRNCILILLSVNLLGCTLFKEQQAEPSETVLPAEVSYLLDVALKAEFGGSNNERVKKWADEMRVYLSDTVSTELQAEFTAIQTEINALAENFKMVRVEEPSLANFLIFVSDGETFAQYEPNARPLIKNNDGLVWIYWDNGFNITRGSMLVDITKLESLDCQKHILREELTQGLGLLNDTFDHPTSIFHQRYTCFPSYADIDLALLELFLSNKIQAGMNSNQVLAALGY